MQIGLNVTVLAICLCLSGIGEKYCRNTEQVPRSDLRDDINNHGNVPDGDSYELIKIVCSEDGICSAILYCDQPLFNKRSMEAIIEKLSIEFKKRKVINAHLFDDKSLAESFARGTRSLGDLQQERRGWYFKGADREFLLFYPDKNRKRNQIKLVPKSSDSAGL